MSTMTVPQDQPDPVQEPKLGGPQDVFYSRDNSVPLPTIARCGGIFLWDEDGNEYIDVSSGPVVSNIGHGNERVADAISRQIKTMDFAYSRVARHRPNIELTKRIAELAGPGYERVFLASGGSEALEIAIKFLRRYVVAVGRPKKQKIISCHPSYHGSTLALLGMGGDETIADFLEGMAEVSTKVPAPLSYRLPEALRAKVMNSDVPSPSTMPSPSLALKTFLLLLSNRSGAWPQDAWFRRRSIFVMFATSATAAAFTSCSTRCCAVPAGPAASWRPITGPMRCRISSFWQKGSGRGMRHSAPCWRPRRW